MKNKIKITLILFLTLIINNNCFSQITSIPDSEFEGALLDLGIDSDGMINGEVLTADVLDVTELNLAWHLISDLTGIEDFENLTNLNCSFMLLSSLDVSANTNLIELRFAGNSISHIDLTSNTDLVVLDLTGNSISELDLSQNLDLETLWALDNDLTELDVSLNTELKIFGCWENSITRLDVSNNPNLEEFWCYKNQLTFLRMDNGNNTAITEFSATDNPDLFCIQSDDSTYSTLNFTAIDEHSYFGENCYLSIASEDKLISKIYPNPAHDFVTIRAIEPASFTLTSLNGATIQKGQLTNTYSQLNLSNLEKGMYVLTIHYPNSNVISKLVVDN